MIIEDIWKAVLEYRKDNGDNVALQVAMHPSVFDDCITENYNNVMSAFDLRLNKKPETIFGYPLLINFDFDEGEWKVQNPVTQK